MWEGRVLEGKKGEGKREKGSGLRFLRGPEGGKGKRAKGEKGECKRRGLWFMSSA